MPERDHQGKGSVLDESRVEKDTSRPKENHQEDDDNGKSANDKVKTILDK